MSKRDFIAGYMAALVGEKVEASVDSLSIEGQQFVPAIFRTFFSMHNADGMLVSSISKEFANTNQLNNNPILSSALDDVAEQLSLTGGSNNPAVARQHAKGLLADAVKACDELWKEFLSDAKIDNVGF